MGSGKNMSNSRVWVIVTILLVACIVALAVGLAIGLRKSEPQQIDEVREIVETCPIKMVSTIPNDSSIYVPATETVEGKYRYLATASDSTPCSKIGTQIMVQKRGSAVDAAIAAILCAGVTHPQSCGIGGGHFLTYYSSAEKKAYNIMAREMAPAGSSQDMYVSGEVDSKYGGMAIGIPGELMGLHEAWQRWGNLTWPELFEPAIKLARDGFKVDKLLHNNIRSTLKFLALPAYEELNKTVTNPDTGALYEQGETMRLPKLANTLQTIANEGSNAFYNGSLTDDIVADIKDAGGNITKDDLLKYTAAMKTPVSFTLPGGDTVYTPPPPSSGSVLILILNILRGYNFTADSFSTVDKTVLTYHRIIEAFKHAYSVRSRLGDVDVESDDFKQTVEDLVNKMVNVTYGASKKAKIDDSRTFATAYYEPAYYTPPDSGTSHLSVLDPEGNAVAITSTVNLIFASKVIGTRTGIIFNNEMDDFSTPGTVNYFGIPASPANYIKPYKRPMSSMSPSIVVGADGMVKLVTGASGGSRIITSTAMSIIQTLWFELGLKEALDYPRVHHQLIPPEARVERRFPQVLLDGLSAKGHNFTMYDSSSTAVQSILQRVAEEIYAACDVTKLGEPDGC